MRFENGFFYFDVYCCYNRVEDVVVIVVFIEVLLNGINYGFLESIEVCIILSGVLVIYKGVVYFVVLFVVIECYFDIIIF